MSGEAAHGRRCGTCRYFDDDDIDDAGRGTCRLNPPTVVIVTRIASGSEMLHYASPMMDPWAGWCGDHTTEEQWEQIVRVHSDGDPE